MDLDADSLLGSFRVNVVAPLFLTRLLAPHLESAAGTVINVGSIHATLSKASFGAYAISKSALAGLSRAMAIELGARIRTIEVRPAAIATPMLEAGFSDRPDRRTLLDQYHPSGAIATPGEVADIVRGLVETRARFANGAVVNVDGGISHVLHDPA